MPVPGILGNEPILGALSRALDEERLPSALLFYGPSGVGKLTAALALFRALLCERSAPISCGFCEGCRRIEATRLLHPDVGLLWPHPRKDRVGETDPEEPPAPPDLHALQDEVRRNGTWRILVAETQARLSELFLSPALGRRRILLILAAERLAEESANTLLKVLEEPPGRSLILLLSESLSALLPTIRSRCQSYRFGPLPRRTLEQFLKSRSEVGEAEARLIFSLSGGRPGHALALVRDAPSYRARRALLGGILREIRRERTAAACLSGVQALLTEEESIDPLTVLMDLLRDAMLRAGRCDPSLLSDPVSAGQEADLVFSAAEAASLIGRVERAREDLRRFVNPQAALESLFLDLAEPLLSPAGRERRTSPPGPGAPR